MSEKEKVFLFLQKNKLPVKTGDISKELKLDRNTVQKILNDLSLENKITLDRCFNKVVLVSKGGSNDR
jgi:Mn-dependent DtxR family transcriptional regulator